MTTTITVKNRQEEQKQITDEFAQHVKIEMTMTLSLTATGDNRLWLLKSAITSGNLSLLSAMLMKDPTLHITPDYNGFSALHYAAQANQIPACELLLRFGASVCYRHTDRQTDSKPYH